MEYLRRYISQVGSLQVATIGSHPIASTIMVVVAFVAFSPCCVLSQDNNFTTVPPTTEMQSSNYIFDVPGTTEAPVVPVVAPSTPFSLTPAISFPRMNRTAFDAFFEQYKLMSGPKNYTSPNEECIVRQLLENLTLEFDLGEGVGRLCPSHYDLIQCWPASTPGMHIRPCPIELNGVKYDTSDNVSRLCHFNGTWGFNGKSDYNRCEPLVIESDNPHEFPIMVITLSGYSLSFAALVGAFVIFLYFKSLRCVRNYIHWNLVSSFILLYMSFFIALVSNQHIYNQDKSLYWICRLLVTVLHYCLMTNFFWMFVEGVYLYTLVARALTVRKDRFWVYIILGWGVPVVFVSVFAILKKQYDSGCWLEENSNVGYIVSAPIIFIICINLIFLIHIMCILVTKLRASHSLETQQYRKAVKGTLVLLPLLGVTYLIFIFKPESDKKSAIFLIFQYLNALLHSTQGFFVAIIYVYMNQEVRNVVGRKIKRWREENTLPTKPVSRRGSNSRTGSLAQIFNSARRGSHHSAAEEATTLPFRLPGTGDPAQQELNYANGSRSPPFVRLDEIQPLNNTNPPSGTSPRTPTSPPSYNTLFPVMEVDEAAERSEHGHRDREEEHPLNEENEEETETEVEVMPNNHIDVSTPDVVCHIPLTNGDDSHTELSNGDGGDIKVKTIGDVVDQNENNKQAPINHCLNIEQVTVMVNGDGQANENNSNNNERGMRIFPKPGFAKKVSFEEDHSPRPFCDSGFSTRGVSNTSAFSHTDVSPPGQSLRHDDVTDNRGKHLNRVECAEKSGGNKQKNCILADVRQKNSGAVNGTIMFPKAPPGTPV